MRIATTLILIGTMLSASLLAADKPKKTGAAPSDKKASSGTGMRTWTDKTGSSRSKNEIRGSGRTGKSHAWKRATGRRSFWNLDKLS